MDDAEAVTQRRRQETGASGRADQRESRQRQTYAARRRALTDHQIEFEILHRRIEDLLDRRRQAVDLVDEQDISGCRLVSIAARSPARSRTGPEVT